MSTDATDTIDVDEMETSAGNALAGTMAEGQPPESPPEAPPAAPSEPEGEPATVTVDTDESTVVVSDAAPTTPEGTETTKDGKTGEGDELTIRSLYDRLAGGAPGHTMQEKYPDDGQFLRGMVHAQGMLGQRNADADLGRAFRGRFGSEAEIQAFLQGQPPAAQPPQQQPPPVAEGTPPTFDQVRLWQQQTAVPRPPDRSRPPR
ncbi:hypothetical protein LCGC14_0939930, partial [marine sediment metagenome]